MALLFKHPTRLQPILWTYISDLDVIGSIMGQIHSTHATCIVM